MEKKLKILIISQYFWPEQFRINDITKDWAARGYNVDVLTALPNYPTGKIFEEFKKNKKNYNEYYGAKIIRIPAFPRGSGSKIRLSINYLSFFLFSLFYLIFKINKKYDIIFTFAISPVSIGLISNLFSFFSNSKTVIWVLDLWPDVLKETGIIKNKFLYDILKKTISSIYANSDLIFTHSKSIKKEIERYNNLAYPIILHSWPEKVIQHNTYSNLINRDKNCLTIMFTGAIGEYQNLENVIKTVKKFKLEECRLFIVGEGREKLNLVNYTIKEKAKNIFFLPYVSFNNLVKFTNHADIFLVSLKPGKVGSYSVPGKLYTYLYAKKPVLGYIQGETKEIIEENNYGMVADPNNSNDLKKKIRLFIDLKKNKKLRKTFNYTVNNKELSKKNCLNLLNKNLQNIINDCELKLVQSFDNFQYNQNFILSGLNLAFIGFLLRKKIKLVKELYNWPDGIFSKLINFNIKKIPGKTLISNLKVPNSIKKIHVIGSLSKNGLNFLENHFKLPIIHTDLPYADIQILRNIVKNIILDTEHFIFLTLPTPKQEQVALELRKYNKSYKIFCIGGAINMLSGDERSAPILLANYFEFLWRLRFDTKRRFARLLNSLFNYLFFGIILRKVSKIKVKFFF